MEAKQYATQQTMGEEIKQEIRKYLKNKNKIKFSKIYRILLIILKICNSLLIIKT